MAYLLGTETRIYLLLGQLGLYLPFEFDIDLFKISPHSMGYSQ